MRSKLVSTVLACAASAAIADDIVWLNIADYPGDLVTTGDAWSAIRGESPDQSYRIAADDFTLDTNTRITAITFFGAEVGEPEILGGDWYIFTGPAEGPPETLVAHGAGVPMAHVDTHQPDQQTGEQFPCIVTHSLVSCLNETAVPSQFFLHS